jgi:peroxiredoxin
MNKKIISLAKFKKYKNFGEINKMFFFTLAVGAALGLILWTVFVDNIANLDVEIPQSKNITFNQEVTIPMTTAQVANEFEKSDGKPILFYLYTTWCSTCTKNFPVFNEIAREFQNTDLQVIALSIDREHSDQELKAYLSKFGDLYFQPRFLAFREGFLEFLQKKNIRYNNRIPFTVLISRDGEVVTKFVGSKSKKYLRNKVIREISN